ncbi:hypothetical protein B9479_007147 [Cryptococcus floricola]|uniref:CxC1-like cysteine cluster associated with KDZ transposases domain-containing protein n=1 Tax=Cryptococcus floricola TaxID=2591691 RepID=A0A5D3AQ06_9TREE|nr:hypothetical protein B9479_007147 [Cryptococcus floricola]
MSDDEFNFGIDVPRSQQRCQLKPHASHRWSELYNPDTDKYIKVRWDDPRLLAQEAEQEAAFERAALEREKELEVERALRGEREPQVDQQPFYPDNGDEDMGGDIYDADETGEQELCLMMASSQIKPPPRPPSAEYKKTKEKEAQAWKRQKDDFLLAYLAYKIESGRFQAPDRGEKATDLGRCTGSCMETNRRTWTVLLVAWDKQWHQKIEFCDCRTPVIRLAAMGFMACTPTRPNTAFALSLMDYGHKLYMQNPLSAEAFANTLWQFHAERGGAARAKKSHRFRDAPTLYRQATLHYRDLVYAEEQLKLRLIFPINPDKGTLEEDMEKEERGKAALKCPLCFGPRKEEDYDPNDPHVIFSMDGNFSQSRPDIAAHHDFYKDDPPSIFLRPHFVRDAMALENEMPGVKVGKADTACSDEWAAKNGDKKDRVYEGKADSGVFGGCCRHGVCFTLINLHKGERMFNPLAIATWFLDKVDKTARYGRLYDVACHLEAHERKRGLLREQRESGRLISAVSVFHAFAHDWPCQLYYNPRYITGFGLSDGEACERLWSGLTPLIKQNRVVASSHRLMNLEFRVSHLNSNILVGAVQWLKKRTETTTRDRLYLAEQHLLDVADRWGEEELQAQADLQREAHSKAARGEREDEREEAYRLFMSIATKRDNLTNQHRIAQEALQRGDITTLSFTIPSGSLLQAEVVQLEEGMAEAAKNLVEGSSVNTVYRLCMLHEAHCQLREAVRSHKFMLEPIRNVRMGMIAPLGYRATKDLLRKIRQGKLVQAMNKYNAALDAYCGTDHPDHPPSRAESVKELLDMPFDADFWKDTSVLFEGNRAPWDWDPACRRGIKALHLRNRSREELRRIRAEIAQMVRWSATHYEMLVAKKEEWVQRSKQWDRHLREEGPAPIYDHGNSLGVDGQPFWCGIVISLLGNMIEDHLRLEELWIGDGLQSLWREHELGAPDMEVTHLLITMSQRAEASLRPASEYLVSDVDEEEEGDLDDSDADEADAAQLEATVDFTVRELDEDDDRTSQFGG